MASRTKRGFAAMDREKQREIASMGGRAAHAKGTAHEFTADEARKAGRRGGRTVSRDRAYMAEIGRRGGLQSQGGQGAPADALAASASQSTGRGRAAKADTAKNGASRARGRAPQSKPRRASKAR